MTRYFLDTEFTKFGGGKLISLALVSENGKHEWYGALNAMYYRDEINIWVNENVIPNIGITTDIKPTFRYKLWFFMRHNQIDEIIADWPEDIMHLCGMMVDENGFCVASRPKFTLVERDQELVSKIPHNALEDAKALRNWYVNKHG